MRAGRRRDRCYPTGNTYPRFERLWPASNYRYEFGPYQVHPNGQYIQSPCSLGGGGLAEPTSRSPGGVLGIQPEKQATQAIYHASCFVAALTVKSAHIHIHLVYERFLRHDHAATGDHRIGPSTGSLGMGDRRWLGETDRTSTGTLLWPHQFQ